MHAAGLFPAASLHFPAEKKDVARACARAPARWCRHMCRSGWRHVGPMCRPTAALMQRCRTLQPPAFMQAADQHDQCQAATCRSLYDARCEQLFSARTKNRFLQCSSECAPKRAICAPERSISGECSETLKRCAKLSKNKLQGKRVKRKAWISGTSALAPPSRHCTILEPSTLSAVSA